MQPAESHALARVGLLGNPSDLYGGRVIAYPFSDFRARVRVEPAECIELAAGTGEAVTISTWDELDAELQPRCFVGGAALIAAALRRLRVGGCLERITSVDPRSCFRVSYTSDIPRQVGLAGSSAIVIAALRAFGIWFGFDSTPHAVAERALQAEVDELGITAGPQDRVVQSFEQPLYMDFALSRRPESYEPFDAELLPPMLVAWDPQPGESSGVVHNDVRLRWLAGDHSVRAVMNEIGMLALEGMRCLRARDHGRFRQLVDRNFDLRAAVFDIAARHREMVEIGRRAGAAAKFCGSGGAVVCVGEDAAVLTGLETTYAAAGFRSLRPRLL